MQFHADSHYVALRLLAGYLPKEQLKLVHYGSPQQRFEAMWHGEVDALYGDETGDCSGRKAGM